MEAEGCKVKRTFESKDTKKEKPNAKEKKKETREAKEAYLNENSKVSEVSAFCFDKLDKRIVPSYGVFEPSLSLCFLFLFQGQVLDMYWMWRVFGRMKRRKDGGSHGGRTGH